MREDPSRVYSGSPFETRFGFCRARREGNRILVAGTAPIGDDGTTVGVGDPGLQASRCLEIIVQAIRALGGDTTDVVRTRMFLTRIDDWRAVGKVHGNVFAETEPVATMVAVQRLIDPDWLVEIEAEAEVRA